MSEVNVLITDQKDRYLVGDSFSGTVELYLPEEVPMSALRITFHCLGEVVWTEVPFHPYYVNSCICHDKHSYMKRPFAIPKKDEKIPKLTKTSIPFDFTIPNDMKLPSTMRTDHGSVIYYVKAAVKLSSEMKMAARELFVESPVEENLAITVRSTTMKHVILHSGHVLFNALIKRKGFAPGEKVPVQVSVINKTSAELTPRVTLVQTQNFMCGIRNRFTFAEKPVLGQPIAAHNELVQDIDVVIPENEMLTIRDTVVSVEYTVHCTLDIPHSFDLHVDLPIVVTSSRHIPDLIELVEELEKKEAENPKRRDTLSSVL